MAIFVFYLLNIKKQNIMKEVRAILPIGAWSESTLKRGPIRKGLTIPDAKAEAMIDLKKLQDHYGKKGGDIIVKNDPGFGTDSDTDPIFK